MANSKIKTLWTIAGRVVDSREILDANGGMLSGRVDIPESLMVKFEGYTKIEYRVTLSDGSVVKYATFEGLMSGFKATVESKNGSGFMTIFLPFNAVAKYGVFQMDVYKEWEDANIDPEPEPQPEPGAPFNGATRWWVPKTSGGVIFSWERWDGLRWINSGLSHDRWADSLVNSFGDMTATKLGNVKAALGITGGGGGGQRPAPLVPDAKYVDLAPMPETPSSVADEAVVIAWMKAVTDMLNKTKANDKEAARAVNGTIEAMKTVGMMQTTK